MTRRWVLPWAVTIGAALLGLGAASGPARADAAKPSDQVVEGAKKIGQGVQETAKGIGKTLTEGAKDVETRAKAAGKELAPTGDKLHARAKGFGEAIWDGMKSTGRALERFFTGK